MSKDIVRKVNRSNQQVKSVNLSNQRDEKNENKIISPKASTSKRDTHETNKALVYIGGAALAFGVYKFM